jgi:hypothetical protein
LRVSNFVGIDAQGSEWICVSTRTYPRERSFRPHHADGFIVRHDRAGAQIIADDIGFSNECRVDPTGAWLYVNENLCQADFALPHQGRYAWSASDRARLWRRRISRRYRLRL